MFRADIDAIIFDMDGVIVDSEPRHERSYLELFAEMGCGDSHGVHFPDYYGRSDRALLTDFVARHQPDQSLDELAALKQARFIEMIRKEQPLFDGLAELVARLAGLYPLAVASGSVHPVIDEVLALEGLRRFFKAVVSVQDVTRGKPEPDIFLRAASLLEVAPERCCVIEDAVPGVQAARSAGMKVIGITNSVSRAELSKAHHVVETYGEIRELLLGAES